MPGVVWPCFRHVLSLIARCCWDLLQWVARCHGRGICSNVSASPCKSLKRSRLCSLTRYPFAALSCCFALAGVFECAALILCVCVCVLVYAVPQDAQKIIKTYNKLAKRLVEFECVWSLAWVESIQPSTLNSINAPLLVRNAADGRLYVNFDHELWQLIKEARCLDRLGGVFIPEPVRVVMLQERKLKDYYDELSNMLAEYGRITARIVPVTADLLQPLLSDVEFKFRPGTLLLTWSSITIDHFKATVTETLQASAGCFCCLQRQRGKTIGVVGHDDCCRAVAVCLCLLCMRAFPVLQRLAVVVDGINGIIEHRIERNLKLVSKTLLVNFPDTTVNMEDFNKDVEAHCESQATMLQIKNVEIESAVDDMIAIIARYPIDKDLFTLSEDAAKSLKRHYSRFMYLVCVCVCR